MILGELSDHTDGCFIVETENPVTLKPPEYDRQELAQASAR
jgi:hypothetical protein